MINMFWEGAENQSPNGQDLHPSFIVRGLYYESQQFSQFFGEHDPSPQKEKQTQSTYGDRVMIDQALKQRDSEDFSQNCSKSYQQSFGESQRFTEDQQKIQMYKPKEFKNRPQKEQKLSLYYLGHLDYLNSCRWSIFGSSRKYERSKKRKGIKRRTELECIARRMKSLKGKRLDTGYPKRFDQELNENFRQLSTKEQAEMDITASALRNVQNNLDNRDNEIVLKAFKEKYEHERYLADFLDAWNNEKQVKWQEDINC